MSEDLASLALVIEGSDYALLTSRDEAAVVLRFKTEHLSAHLRGDDAARFRADYDTIRRQFPAWPPDQMLAQLWDHGGYGWLAAQDGD